MKIVKVKCLAPTRLDNYLMQQFPALNPGRLNKALRENKIKLNGKKQPLSTRVMAGDEIKLFILDEVLDADKRVEGPAWKNARGPAQVIYDCPQILVVNKPAGLAVDGPEDDTLLNRALLYLNQQGEYKENDLYTPALCHRLDTGTSGLVILAKTPEAEQLFLEVIKNREVKKTYLCVTFGRPVPPDGTLGGQHRLPHPRRQQVRQQFRQPRTEAEVSGPLRLGACPPPLHPARLRRPFRQSLPCPETVVLSAGAGWDAEISCSKLEVEYGTPKV